MIEIDGGGGLPGGSGGRQQGGSGFVAEVNACQAEALPASGPLDPESPAEKLLVSMLLFTAAGTKTNFSSQRLP